MWVTKEQVIEALKNEPLKRLRAEGWINMEKRAYTDPSPTLENFGKMPAGNCSVCAVGAVLRNVLPLDTAEFELSRVARKTCGVDWDLSGDEDVDITGDTHSHLVELKKKRYFAALSNLFESNMLGRKYCSEAIRQKLIRFVRRNFPKRLKLKGV